MTRIHTIGLDVSKNIFQVHAADKSGAIVARRKLQRRQVAGYFKRLDPCVVGIEATGGVHHWGRLLSEMGHTVKLMPAAYVKAYVKTNKNDVIDAEAICEAVRRPNMRFVRIKDQDQQAILTLHRLRALLIRQRTMLSNALRGFLSEFGIVIPPGVAGREQAMTSVASARLLPEMARAGLEHLVEQFRTTVSHIARLDKLIKSWHKASEPSGRLAAIPGIGTLTASALVASVGDASQFRSGRQLAAWIGLVPQQFSSGGKTVLGRIPKRGDHYLRNLFYLGAMGLISKKAKNRMTRWGLRLRRRKPKRVAIIALANKLARVAWAILARNEEYRASGR